MNIDLGYFAGLFDGEGSISLVKRKNQSIRLEILVTNTYIPVLEDLRGQYQGYLYTRKLAPGRHKPLAYLRWQGSRAAELLETLLPKLRIKRDQAELALQFQQIPREHGWRQEAERHRQRMLELNGNIHRR